MPSLRGKGRDDRGQDSAPGTGQRDNDGLRHGATSASVAEEEFGLAYCWSGKQSLQGPLILISTSSGK